MYKKIKLSVILRGLHSFKGLCLMFLPNVSGAMFIQGAMFIPDSRLFIADNWCLDLTVLIYTVSTGKMIQNEASTISIFTQQPR